MLWLEQGRLREAGSAKTVCEHYLATLFQTQSSGMELAQRSFGDQPALAADRPPVDLVDQRLAFLNQSRFRNDLELFAFRPEVEALMNAAEKVAKVPLKATGRGELIMKDSTSGKKSKKKSTKR